MQSQKSIGVSVRLEIHVDFFVVLFLFNFYISLIALLSCCCNIHSTAFLWNVGLVRACNSMARRAGLNMKETAQGEEEEDKKQHKNDIH